MKFCKKCMSIMKPINNNTFECLSCKSIEEGTGNELIAKEKVDSKKINIKQGVVQDGNIFATYDSFICEKCGFDKAQIIERQPYISDEDSLTFLRCGKCGWTKQLARKTR